MFKNAEVAHMSRRLNYKLNMKYKLLFELDNLKLQGTTRQCLFFSRRFSICSFASKCMFGNQKGSPLLHFSALCDIFRKNFFSKI